MLWFCDLESKAGGDQWQRIWSGGMKISRIEIVGGISFVLAVIQIVLDGGRVEATSLILLGVAGSAFVLPDLVSERGLFWNLKKIRLGQFEAEFEAEFEQKILAVEENIIKAEERETEERLKLRGNIPPLEKSYVEEYERVVSSPASNREKIILGGLLVERLAEETAQHLQMDTIAAHSARDIVLALQSAGFLSEGEVAAYDSFWKLRNFAVHSAKDNLTDEQTLRLLDLLWRLVKVFG